MKQRILKILIAGAVLTFALFIFKIVPALADEISVVDYGAVPADTYNAAAASSATTRFEINRALHEVFNPELEVDEDNRLVVRFPAIEGAANTFYVVDGSLLVYSNTDIVVDEGVYIVSNKKGSIIKGAHSHDGGETFCNAEYDKGQTECNTYGYDQIENVSITGGTWLPGSASDSALGIVGDSTYDCQPIVIRHGRNITLQDLTVAGGTNHFINTSGCQDVLISGVTVKDGVVYTGDEASFWNGQSPDVRFFSIEGIHLDFTASEGEPTAFPLDGTPCQNVTVENCEFINTFTGVGTHHTNIEPASDITITDCTFTNMHNDAVEGGQYGNAVYFMSADGMTISNNIINGVYSAVSVEEATNVCIEDNTINDCHGNAILLLGGSDATSISNNDITDVVQSGIYVGDKGKYTTGSSSAVVSGNTITNCGNCGLFVTEESYLDAYDNTINSPDQYGVYIAKNSSAVLTDNIIWKAGNRGVFFYGADSLTLEGGEITIDATKINKANNEGDGIFINAPGATATIRNVTFNNIPRIAIGASSSNGDITIDGVTVNGSGQTGITVTGANNVTLNNSLVKNVTTTYDSAGGYGIWLKDIQTLNASENTIKTTAAAAVGLSNITGGEFSNSNIRSTGANGVNVIGGKVTVSENIIENAKEIGIYAENSTGGSLNNNNISGGKHGILFKGGTLTVEGNEINNSTGGNGININNVAGGSVKNNTIKNSSTHGIYMEGKVPSVTGNIIENSGSGSGLRLKGVSGGPINNNAVKGSGSHGVYITDTNSVQLNGNSSSQNASGKKDFAFDDNSNCANVTFKNNRCGEGGYYAKAIETKLKSGDHNVHIGQGNATITNIVNSASGTKIAWKAKTEDYITGYKIFRKVGSGNWSLIKSITGKNTNNYTDTTVASGTTYKYLVTTVYKQYDQCTAASDADTKSVTFYAAPKLTAATNTVSGVKLTWGKVNGVAGYKILRKTGSGSFSVVKTVNGADTVAATDTTAASGTKYTYTVRGIDSAGNYVGSYYGSGTNTRTIIFYAAPRISTVANTVSGPKITWNKVNGAVAYRVMRKTGSGNFVSVGVTTSTSYVDKTAKSGTAYTYAVRCCAKDGSSNHSSYYAAGKSMTYIAAPKVPTVSNTSLGPKITWTKATGAAAYKVLRKTGSGAYTTLGTTTSLNYVDKTAKNGTSYTYAIVCCTKDGKTNTSSYYAAGTTIKCKR